MNRTDSKLTEIMARLLDGNAGTVQSVERLGGLNHQSYEVNHQYIVKFPNADDSLDVFRKKAQLMAVLGEYVKFKLPQIEIKEFPADEKTARIVPVYSGHVMAQVYPKIQGTTLNEKRFLDLADPVQKQILTDQAVFAAQIHAVPLGRVYGLIDDTFIDNLSAQIEAVLPELHTYDDTFGARLKRTVLDEVGWLCHFVPTHNDQHLGNSVIDEKTGKIIGMIDMDDIIVRRIENAKGLRLFSKSHLNYFRKKYTAFVTQKNAALLSAPQDFVSPYQVIGDISRRVFKKMKER